MVLSMDKWEGKVAIVTGASSGIGEAIAIKLVEHGMQVVGAARRKDRLESLAKKLSACKGKFYPTQCDVSKEEDILKLFKWTEDSVGPVHVLVNNAGVVCKSAIAEGKTEDWLETINVNVIALNICTREALRHMTKHNIDGHVININSIAGHYILDIPKVEIYTATKHAVTALTECMRKEMARLKKKIRFTSVSPGLVDTEIVSKAREANPEMSTFLDNVPALKSEDIADAVEYALSTPPHVQIDELMIRPVGSPL